MPAAFGVIFAMVPLFPSFIALTDVDFPGFSLVPRGIVLAVLAVCALLAVYAVAMLVRFPERGAQPLLLPLLALFGAGLLAGCLGFNPSAGFLFTGIGGFGIIWQCAVMRFYSDRYAAHAIYYAYSDLRCARRRRRDRDGGDALSGRAVRHRARARDGYVHSAR